MKNGLIRMKNNQNILALDISVNSTGVYLKWGNGLCKRITITNKPHHKMAVKMVNFYDIFKSILHLYDVNVIIKEEMVYNVFGKCNKKGIVSTGTMHNLLDMVALENKVDVISISLKDIAKVMNLSKLPKGSTYIQRKNYKKEQTIDKINSIYKLKLNYKDNDIADAIAVYHTYLTLTED